MTDALIEIVIPLIVALLAGVFIGWLLWRWRRTPMSSQELHTLEARANRREKPRPERDDDPFDRAHEISELQATLEVRNIEIAQLRRAIAGTVETSD